MTTTALDPLGPDALHGAVLTELVPTVTGDPDAVPLTVRVEQFPYEIGTPSTAALLRVLGTAQLSDGSTTDWACFVKKLQSPRHWPLIHLVPEHYRAEFIRKLPWQLEIAVHRSGLAELLPDGLRLATAYRIDEYADDRATLWMEYVEQEPGVWPLERFGRAAFLLGRLSARRQPHLVDPLIPRDGTDESGVGLRYYTEGRVLSTALPLLADQRTWRHPLLAAAVCNTGDHGLKDELLELAERLPAVLDALDALPQCYQHGDASPQNLLVPRDAPDEFVVIDWGFDCPQAVGFDLGQLLVGLAHAGELPPSALPAVHEVILKAFREGLAAEGMQVPEEQVRYGYLGSLLARAAFTALPLERLNQVTTDADVEYFENRVLLTRALVDLMRELD
ncbi:aminoglycoside phosphotransferase [Kribbella flavida DSM 17836]|uniref:Aminoglycoside phosphotransferase n=1 Tax=Kribbella flavida (strain DSM 17836 / JCM 10339 / NBRC 14399) TaxID=479435 RepID=D2PNC8_KRIFD|nr:phosphotransferase [Kribbella flavida]ADB34612.1 aminoglycoside phosphotransferase [Kribbella flavida DSM 17836]